jgi:hypothetical protein
VEEFIARENVRRYEAQLARCDDEEQRRVLIRLLEAERNRLSEIERRSLLDIPDANEPLSAETPRG